MIVSKLSGDLTSAEKEAATAYGADSSFFHAVWQGRGNDVCHHPDYPTFAKTADAHRDALDGAIAKSRLESSATLFSGYGRGASVVGALTGDPETFVGLLYCYPGFISTSESRLTAEDAFLRKSASKGSRPTLLEFHLPAGHFALDMHAAGHSGEFEFLLARNQPFKIVNADRIRVRDIEDCVLHLVLKSVW